MALFADEEQQFQILSRLQDPAKYGRLMDAAKDLCQQFEKTDLQSMYQHVGNSIREADTTHILFLEHFQMVKRGTLHSNRDYQSVDPVGKHRLYYGNFLVGKVVRLGDYYRVAI